VSRTPAAPLPAAPGAEIAAAYAAGATLATLAGRYPMHPPRLARIIREAGGTIRPPHKRGPGTDPAALAAACAQAPGLTAAAAQFGISRAAARRLLHSAGMAVIRKPPPADEVAAAYQSGLTVRQCAAKFTMSHSTVLTALRQAGCQVRPPGPRPVPRPAEGAQIAAAYAGGLTLAQCTANFCRSRDTVTAAIRAAGGTIRPPGPRPP
jgi:hypothetical protein